MNTKIIRGIPLIVVLFSHLALSAGEPGNTAKCDVSGTGSDQHAAIVDGLAQAIQQINGVTLKQTSISQAAFLDQVTEAKEAFKASTVSQEDIQTVSKGIVAGYEILESHEDPQAHQVHLRMRVRVWVYDPNIPLLAGRRKIIAVLPFRSALPNYQIFGANYPATRAQASVSQGLVEGLVQSRKFTVLDRDFLAELLGEQKLMQAVNMPAQELVRLDQLKGADYLLVGSIDDLDAASDANAPAGPGARREIARHAKVSVSYRLLNLATGKVHWADTFHRTYNENDLRNLPPDRAGLRIEEMLIADATAVISDQVITGVFPIRVLNVDGPDVILSQGGKRVAIGEELDVYNLGKQLFDPDTNEPLDQVEVLAARVRVVRTTNKMTYTEIVSGDGGKIKVEDAICRRHLDALAKYFQSGTNDGAITAVAVVNANNNYDREIGLAISKRLTAADVKSTSDLFTSAFVADGLFDRVYSGAAKDIPALLAKRCAYVVLARKTSDVGSRPPRQGLITGHGSLDIRVIRSADGNCVDQFLLSTDTSGFGQDKAEARLDEKLQQELEKHGFGQWAMAAKGTGTSPGK